ncbi:MAG: hypothetical protein GTO41_17645 [Burkholderiales bacterium]|nr:hypothetical protein [Burkholderiales bacterium]
MQQQRLPQAKAGSVADSELKRVREPNEVEITLAMVESNNITRRRGTISYWVQLLEQGNGIDEVRRSQRSFLGSLDSFDWRPPQGITDKAG